MILQFVLSKVVEAEEFRVVFFILFILFSKFEWQLMELALMTP